MKEPYYSQTTIQSKATEFCAELQEFRIKHPVKLEPKKTALLVIDMQEFFLDPNSHAFVPSAPTIIPNIQKLQNYFITHKMSVIQTQHGNTKENAGSMAKWWGNHFLRNDDPKTKIISELQQPAAKVIKKTQYDAFYNTNLEHELKSVNMEQLIITGVMTHLCCDTTARAAFTRGFEVVFAVDAAATYNQQLHLGTLRNLAHGCALPLLTDEILCQLRLTLP